MMTLMETAHGKRLRHRFEILADQAADERGEEIRPRKKSETTAQRMRVAQSDPLFMFLWMGIGMAYH